MKRFTHASQHKSFKVQSNATPQAFRLFDFIGKHRDKRATQSYHSKLNRTTQNIDMWKQRTLQLSAPSKIDVSTYLFFQCKRRYLECLHVVCVFNALLLYFLFFLFIISNEDNSCKPESSDCSISLI